jgi:formylmethanofuran dehydrogenase subunit C
MSDWITLTARAVNAPIALDDLDPAQLAELSAADIGALPVFAGRQRAPLGDFFAVSGERSTRVRIEGSTRLLDGVGAGMTGGELEVGGDTGTMTGAGMSGGSLRVHGTVGDAAGLGMTGGFLQVDGNAGDRPGAAAPGAAKGMSGGEIIVLGSAGDEAGARMRRGLLVIAGNAGRDAGRAMIAGSIIVLGACGEGAGRASKRGSIVVYGAVTVPSTYRYACTYHPPHLRLTLRYLARRYDLALENTAIDSLFKRYCGDGNDPGKGELLVAVAGR